MRNERLSFSSEIRTAAEKAVSGLRNFFSGPRFYHLVVSDDFDDLLGRIANQKGILKSDVLRRALASYYYLWSQLKPDAQNPEKHLVIRQGPRIVQRVNLP